MPRPMTHPLLRGFCLVTCIALLFAARPARAAGADDTPFTEAATAPPPLVVHEWGTFTSLEDEDGHAVGSINVDDEPLPPFVGRVGAFQAYQNTARPVDYSKGAPVGHPDVTMRLETPVIYFHRGDYPAPLTGLKVKASFHGGWLTEFYPPATTVVGPGPQPLAHGHIIASDSVGSLEWAGLSLGPLDKLTQPATGYNVWLAPRAVRANMVTAAKGEREQFIFYRGVGRLDAPLRIRRDAVRDALTITGRPPEGVTGGAAIHVEKLWLVDVRPDKSVAFRPFGFAGELAELGRLRATLAGHFAPEDYEPDRLEKLQTLMAQALTQAGLFDDEAAAMLKTWQLSYFQSPGLRLFFIVPQAWTDAVLPLEINVPNQTTRVMVGRIELVTPEQRKLLATIAAGPAPSGGPPAAGSPGSPVEQAYSQLARFRQALVLDELRREPTPELQAFIKQYGLQPNEAH